MTLDPRPNRKWFNGSHSLEERLWGRVRLIPDCCWEWEGTVNATTGYGVISREKRTYGVHRVAYELLVGPIPEGLHIDHLCRNRTCVRPDHLEPVTEAENIRRGVSPSAINLRRTHCTHGHPFDEQNTYRNPRTGRRACRACGRAYAAGWRRT